ncbi:MAG: HAD hydrolase-like protein [Ilumatobacter sp.]
MTPTTHVLLDLDGTLTNSEPGIGASLKHAFNECGYAEPDDDMIRSMIGPPFELSFPRHGIHVDDIQRVIDAYGVRYRSVGLFENSLYDGVLEMMNALTEAGHTLTLATAKPEDTAFRICDHFGLSEYFTRRAGATNDVGGRRTKGEVITHALQLLGVSPHDRIALDHVIMVGDRDHDVEGAHLNAIDCVGVTWGFGSLDELTDEGAAAVVDHPRDVVAAVAAVYRSHEG